MIRVDPGQSVEVRFGCRGLETVGREEGCEDLQVGVSIGAAAYVPWARTARTSERSYMSAMYRQITCVTCFDLSAFAREGGSGQKWNRADCIACR